MPFIKPNKYWPRPDWKQMLKMLGGGFPPWHAPVGSFQLDLLTYQQKRGGGMLLPKAWAQVKMSRKNAERSLMTAPPMPNNLSGLIPPEIFSRVLARSRSTAAEPDPNEEAVDAVIVDPPQAGVAKYKAAAAKFAATMSAEGAPRTAKRKAAGKAAKPKSAKRKTAKRRTATRRPAKRGSK